MSRKNKFGFEPIEPEPVARKPRDPGPMSVAVRDAADNLAKDTDAMLEQRRKNAADAKAFREAEELGLVLQRLRVDAIGVDALPRDRIELDAVASSDEMEELKASIRVGGQKEPIEIFLDANGSYQLKKGWRRLTALRQLFAETGDASFSEVVARVVTGEEPQLTRYLDMVEENVIREDLSFAEMAQVAIVAAADAAVEETDADALVGRIYHAFHKMKRSYVRSFVYLLAELGDALSFPKEISRNLGVEVARVLRSGEADADALRARVSGATSAVEQNAILAETVAFAKSGAAPATAQATPRRAGEKREFRLRGVKATARKGEFRMTSSLDYAAIDRETLERAVAAFEDVLVKG